MNRLIHIVDNFYKNPDAVRNLALNSAYEDVTGLNYPGEQSIHAFVSSKIKEKFESLLQKKILLDESKLTFGKFRLMIDDQRSWLKVHVDGASDWTGVLYLNKDDQTQGGTNFYRHKATGLEGPPSPEKLKELEFKTYKELEETIIKQDTQNLEKWRRSMFVSMKFNRLVLFRGNQLFHAHTHAFGTSIQDGRLTQNFFFNER